MRPLALAALLSACSLTTNTDGIFGAPDATRCGQEGAPCCTSALNRCDGALLQCVRDECVQVAPCGGDGEECCNGTSCNGGLVCEQAGCMPILPPPPVQPCGGSGQPCCAASACNAGLVCKEGACVGCGSYGQPCCAPDLCRGDTACVSGVCRACCAKCNNRDLYHRVFVSHDCTAASRSYCAVGTRGGLEDAKWGACRAY